MKTKTDAERLQAAERVLRDLVDIVNGTDGLVCHSLEDGDVCYAVETWLALVEIYKVACAVLGVEPVYAGEDEEAEEYEEDECET